MIIRNREQFVQYTLYGSYFRLGSAGEVMVSGVFREIVWRLFDRMLCFFRRGRVMVCGRKARLQQAMVAILRECDESCPPVRDVTLSPPEWPDSTKFIARKVVAALLAAGESSTYDPDKHVIVRILVEHVVREACMASCGVRAGLLRLCIEKILKATPYGGIRCGDEFALTGLTGMVNRVAATVLDFLSTVDYQMDISSTFSAQSTLGRALKRDLIHAVNTQRKQYMDSDGVHVAYYHDMLRGFLRTVNGTLPSLVSTEGVRVKAKNQKVYNDPRLAGAFNLLASLTGNQVLRYFVSTMSSQVGTSGVLTSVIADGHDNQHLEGFNALLVEGKAFFSVKGMHWKLGNFRLTLIQECYAGIRLVNPFTEEELEIPTAMVSVSIDLDLAQDMKGKEIPDFRISDISVVSMTQ